MKALIAPSYYPKFSCIADRCRHNCCIGWEIEIDEKSLKYYEGLDGQLGERIKSSITKDKNTAYFKLDSDERCPFLAKDNLCDIIRHLGAGALCDICTDHPRYRNFYSDFTEIGLGLSCEEAARLIINWQPKVKLLPLNENQLFIARKDEYSFLSFRDELIHLLQDRSLSFKERLHKIEERCKFQSPSPSEYSRILKKTERMDQSFNQLIDSLTSNRWPTFSPCWEIPLEQLGVYFIYRHLTQALEDGMLQERVAFSLISVLTIGSMAALQMQPSAFSIDLLVETARLYSAEIEYSDQNIQLILSNLELN